VKKFKISCEEKLYEIIKTYTKSRGTSMNQMTIHLLEVGILKIMDQKNNNFRNKKINKLNC